MSEDNQPLPTGAKIYDLGESAEEPSRRRVAIVGEDKVIYGEASRHPDGVPLDPEATYMYVDENSTVRDSFRLSGGNGPAQVSTPAYRNNYDAIFSKELN